MDSVIVTKGLVKKYKKFTLGPVDLEIPKGFSTALIGANGAGKTTLLDTICGIIAPSKGEVTYFGEITDIEEGETKERIGYLAAQGMYPMSWPPFDVAVANKLGFNGFDEIRYWELCEKYGVAQEGERSQTLMKMSDGNRIRLCLAAVFARDTELLVLDEPGSNLDPLMRDRLCGQFREYLEEGDGEKTIVFSTHNIADMENVTDYAVLMYNGAVIESGFVSDLCERYLLVSGEKATFDTVKRSLMVEDRNMSTCFGFAKAEERETLEAAGAVVETPNLQQLSIFLLRYAEQQNS
ncbi:MAG: ABC transporter ATP-binding protein [Lachnospiraceae bacterium]|nr:ABC transporter ATP-binding protein [Lachnospiraceae bacterium]